MPQTKTDLKKQAQERKERDSLREYAETFFARHGQDVFDGLGVAVGLKHWLGLTTIYLDLARPWGKKGRERLGSPDGDGWVSVDELTNLLHIQRARVTLQTALRICKAIRGYLTKEVGDYKGAFPKVAEELYEIAQVNFANSTVTINALYKAAKSDSRFRDDLAVKAPDWQSRAAGTYNTLLRRLACVGLDSDTLSKRHSKDELTIADAPFLFLTVPQLEGLITAVDEAVVRHKRSAPLEARIAVANDLLDIAIAQADNESIAAQMEEAIAADEGARAEMKPAMQGAEAT